MLLKIIYNANEDDNIAPHSHIILKNVQNPIRIQMITGMLVPKFITNTEISNLLIVSLFFRKLLSFTSFILRRVNRVNLSVLI